MKKQYAVFGLGSFGESVAIELQKLGCEVVAIDANMERVEAIANQVSYAMKADIEDADFIRSLGTRNLDGVVVAASDNMEASIMATLVCKEIGVPYVMAKAKNELHATVLEKIGADSVIFPEKEMGMRKFNPEKGRPYRYDTNPDNAQKVAPSNESRTQVAVNSEGKTNEATKNLKEPLRKGQTAPKDTAQQQQQEKPQKKNNKGMKM